MVCTMGDEAFTRIPVLDLQLINCPRTKPIFLSQLRKALVVVGFFYLRNPQEWIPRETQRRFVEKSISVCNMPEEKKQEIAMINSKHFLGYSRLGHEKTARKIDHREMFDFLSPLPPPGPHDPIYLNVQGPNQWPNENYVPGFRGALEEYLAAVGALADTMKGLVAEALDLEPAALTGFFNSPPRNKVSLLKYPEPDSSARTDDDYQGVGPHKDGGFLTYLLQATGHAGLEAQNRNGDWIDVPPLDNTLVVNVGRSLEAMTKGVCQATTHRVNCRPENFVNRQGQPLGHRYSFPVFQTLRLDLTTDQLQSLSLPSHITGLVTSENVRSDAEAYFAKFHLQGPGMGIFTARLTSHPEVGRRWYPEITERVLEGQKTFVG